MIVSRCHCCHQEEETFNHLFLQQLVAKRIWEMLWHRGCGEKFFVVNVAVRVSFIIFSSCESYTYGYSSFDNLVLVEVMKLGPV